MKHLMLNSIECHEIIMNRLPTIFSQKRCRRRRGQRHGNRALDWKFTIEMTSKSCFLANHPSKFQWAIATIANKLARGCEKN
jgi:hypothetical protein